MSSTMCSRNRKKVEEQRREERKDEIRGETESRNTSQARSLDFILKTQKRNQRALSREKKQKMIYLPF